MRGIYLDYNATTPVAPSVYEAMTPFLTEHYGNPSSSHALGRACREAMEDARSKIAVLLGADRDEIVFTSGATESNNLATQGLMMRDAPSLGGHLIISAVEHPAVAEPARYLERLGFDLTVVGCDAQGQVDPGRVTAAMRPNTRLVSIMHANNETGVLQPLREIADICHARNVRLHTDAAQTFGKIPTFVDELGVDLLSLAGHKCYAPKGIGALYIRRGVRLEPVLHGAGHEGGLRPGTENVASIVGLGQAARLAFRSLDESAERLAMLRDRLCAQLSEVIGERLVVNGRHAPRLPNTLSVNFLGISATELLARIPEMCVSTGSTCHSGLSGLSPTMAAMGIDPDDARGTVRFSVGWFTSEEDVARAADLVLGAWEALS
ncbi:MAG: cysteine desulfurase family protein [Planctomycetota bacterium]|nr:cysteine desulfurase family protein [Planctomycetota bacterium]